LLLAISILWNPFGADHGLDHLGAWRVMLYPLLLLPVLPSRWILLAALLLGGFTQLGFMTIGGAESSLHRQAGPLQNVNIAGMWGAVLATAGTAALLWGRWWGLLVMAAGMIISLSTFSRGGLAAMAAGVSVVLVVGILASRGRERWWRLGRVLLPLAAAAVLAMAVLPVSARRIQRSLTQVIAAQDTSDPASSALMDVDPARFHLWRLAMLKAQERPILGWGFGAYPSITTSTIDTFDRSWWALPGQFDSVSSIGRFRGSHSMYMRIACEQGLIGLLTLLAALTFTFEALGRLTRRSAMALGGLGVVVAWMVFAGTEDAHTMTRALLPVPLVLALVILGDQFDSREQA
jgi:O-antigen ligase